jgi:hypothetical protein
MNYCQIGINSYEAASYSVRTQASNCEPTVLKNGYCQLHCSCGIKGPSNEVNYAWYVSSKMFCSSFKRAKPPVSVINFQGASRR